MVASKRARVLATRMACMGAGFVHTGETPLPLLRGSPRFPTLRGRRGDCGSMTIPGRKRRRLENNGWKIGKASEFLGLSPEEEVYVLLVGPAGLEPATR